MSRRCPSRARWLLLPLAAWTAVALAAPAAPAGKYGLGKPATAEEIAGWDIDVKADGTGLPPGRGSAAQGQVIYDAKCGSCHGTFGESNSYLQIAGGVGTLASATPIRTTGSKLNFAPTLFDYIRRAMPFNNPQSLSNDEVYALTAYVLALNEILPENAVVDRDSLPLVRMPNRGGFTTAHGFMRRDGKPDTSNVACKQDCVRDVRVSSALPAHALDAHGELAEQRRPLGAIAGIKTTATHHATASSSPTPSGNDLAKRLGCLGCHGIDRAVVGPAFRDIATRYGRGAGSAAADADVKLVAKLKTGGAGVWGATPMPGQPQVGAADAEAVIQWILAGAP